MGDAAFFGVDRHRIASVRSLRSRTLGHETSQSAGGMAVGAKECPGNYPPCRSTLYSFSIIALRTVEACRHFRAAEYCGRSGVRTDATMQAPSLDRIRFGRRNHGSPRATSGPGRWARRDDRDLEQRASSHIQTLEKYPRTRTQMTIINDPRSTIHDQRSTIHDQRSTIYDPFVCASLICLNPL